MLLGPPSKEQQRTMFQVCLKDAIENGSMCRTDTGLDFDVEQAITAVALADTPARKAKIAAAEKALEASLSDNSDA